MEIFLTAHDLDQTTDVDLLSDLVDEFVISPNISSTSHTFSDTNSYSGVNDIAHIQLAFRLTCSADHYGPDCSYCVDTNDETGHYSCDTDTGNKVCLEGYQIPMTDCTECAPTPNCSEYTCTVTQCY